MKQKLFSGKTLLMFFMTLFSLWSWGQYSYTFTSSQFTANNQTKGLDGVNWTLVNNGGYYGYEGTKGQQIGSSGSPATSMTLKTSSISGVIQSVKIYTSGASAVAANVSVSVNGTSYGSAQTITTTNTAYTFNGSSTGEITIAWSQTSSKALYFKQIEVTYSATSLNPPTVTPSSQTGTVGTVFSYQVQATEAPGSYAVVPGNSLPDGLSLDTTSGAITGTPVTAGSFTTNITATNNAGTSSPAAIDFTIAQGNQTITGFTDTTKYLSSPAFTFAANTDIANLPVTYASSDLGVATISGNTITIQGVGTTNITATQAGDSNWNALNQQITLTVLADPLTYNGVGRFEKINNLTELTDGYYVVVGDGGNAMNSTVTNNKLQSNGIAVSNNEIIDPATNIVWKIQTDAGNVKTIYNEEVDKYVSGGGSNTNVSLASTVQGDSQKWEASNVSNLFRLTNQVQPSRALLFNGSVFGQYATSNVGSGYYDVALYKRIEATIWNGTTWSNGDPNNKDVIITGSYSTAAQPSFTAKNIIVKDGGILEVTSGNSVDAENITVEDGGNFIQRDGSTVNYTGSFKVLKNGLSVVDKYTFWSSPVANQDLTAIYGPGNTPSFITQYDTATDYFVNAASTVSTVGTGYSIKTPVPNAALTFTGSPNNGLYTKPLLAVGNGFNLIGNPYSSNLDLTAFYNANSARISNTFYFWDNTSNSVTTQGGASTTNIGYATYNPAAQVWVPAPNIAGIPANNVASIGQGFIVKATNPADTSLTFTNDMRVGTDGAFFNKTNTTSEGKFWLRLSSSYNTKNTLAVAYLAQASAAYDQYDSKALATGSDAFYTLADAHKLVIQGRGDFNINDIVPVTTKHFEAGNFVISLVKKEGIFDNGQAVYIHDKVLGTYTNLQDGDYTFSANAGELANRFEIVYKPLNVLAVSETDNAGFEVFKDGEEYVVRNKKNIDKIEVYDASGRKISQSVVNAKETRFRLDVKGLYILKAVSAGKEYTKKIN